MHLIGKNVFAVPIGYAAQQNVTATRLGLRYCPSMDLIAIFPQVIPSEALIKSMERATTIQSEQYYGEESEISIEVYRLNGQKVFTTMIENTNDAVHVVDLAWRADGVMMAVVTSDNIVRLVNSFSGKIIHTHSALTKLLQTPQETTDTPRSPSTKRKSMVRDDGPVKRRCMPTMLHYSTHFSDTKSTKGHLSTASEDREVVLDDLLSLNADIENLLKVKADLPRKLANIDIEQYLPKLATLPANGLGEEDIFSSRTSIDAIFHSAKQSTGSATIDVVVTTQSDGYVHVRIFDSFEIGDIDVSQAAKLPANVQVGKINCVITHPFSEVFYLIVEELHELHSRSSRSQPKFTRSPPAQHLLMLSPQFLHDSASTLPILATKATQLQNLIKYLQQIEVQMAREAKTAFDLPARFIRNLEEDLKEQDGEGSTFETSAYDTLLTGQVHGKFKEWLVEVLGDRGAKRWDKSVSDCLDLVRRLVSENWNPAVERAGIVVSRLAGIAMADGLFGLEKHILDGLQQTIDVMAILGEDLLNDVCNEMIDFNAFMKWLKREVEMGGLEDTSEKLHEMREGSDYSETKKVIRYISTNLHDTSVQKYIHSENSTTSSTTKIDDGVGFYETYKKNREISKDSHLISMRSVTTRLRQQCEQLFQQVALKLREGVLIEYLCTLEAELDSEVFDARLVWTLEHPSLHIVGKSKTEARKTIHLQADMDCSKTAIFSKQSSSLDCDEILDIKIADDKEIMILTAGRGHTSFVVSALQDPMQLTVRHQFGDEHDEYTKAGLVPRRLEVNGRKNRRTVTILDEQGRGYGVFDLDSSANNKDGDDNVMNS